MGRKNAVGHTCFVGGCVSRLHFRPVGLVRKGLAYGCDDGRGVWLNLCGFLYSSLISSGASCRPRCGLTAVTHSECTPS